MSHGIPQYLHNVEPRNIQVSSDGNGRNVSPSSTEDLVSLRSELAARLNVRGTEPASNTTLAKAFDAQANIVARNATWQLEQHLEGTREMLHEYQAALMLRADVAIAEGFIDPTHVIEVDNAAQGFTRGQRATLGDALLRAEEAAPTIRTSDVALAFMTATVEQTPSLELPAR